MAQKPFLLSAEVSRACALLAGGAPGPVALNIIREWDLRAPARGANRAPPGLRRWGERLATAVREAIPLGAPIGTVLREIYPMIRSDERQWVRLRAIERQFGFQGALAVVLPWAVMGMTEGVRFNFVTVAGGAFQALGLAFFTLVIMRAVRIRRDEAARAFELATGAWMRVMSGQSLRTALEGSLLEQATDPFKSAWLRWLAAFEGGADLTGFEWPVGFDASREIALVLGALLKTGAPAAAALADTIARIGDERQAASDERLAALPTSLSLVYCGTLAPGFFLILAGGLWPMFADLWT